MSVQAVRPLLDEAELLGAIEAGRGPDCHAWLDRATSDEATHALAGLSDGLRTQLLSLLTPEQAVEALEHMPDTLAADAIESLDRELAADIIEQLASDEQADLIQSLDEDDAEEILTALDEEVAGEIRKLAAYGDDAAGSLMLTEYLSFADTLAVRDVLDEIERNAEQYADYNIQYSYVTDAEGRLRGVLPLRSLLLAQRSRPVSEIMINDPISIPDTMPMDELRALFRDHPYIGLPVVDETGVMIGVVERRAVASFEAEEAEDVYRQSQGIVGGEEIRSMPLVVRSRRRLAWLSVNIVLNIIAASVIALHQSTLEAVIALAVFLPIISDMSGCSGNQAVAVSMRELTLGVTRPRDIMRVLFKESSLGIINGIVLGALIGGVAFLWKGNIYLSAVVGISLALNTLVAVCIGGSVPLLLKRFKTDPALASGPILTTITDMCGFLIVLTLASLMLTQLTGV